MPQVMNGKQMAHRNITVMTCKIVDMFILKFATYTMFEAFFWRRFKSSRPLSAITALLVYF